MLYCYILKIPHIMEGYIIKFTTDILKSAFNFLSVLMQL